MKKVTTLLSTLVFALIALPSSAGLINFTTDQASYTTGDTILVNIQMNDINIETAELGFALNFDDSLMAFNSFTFSDDVFFSAFIADAQLSPITTNIVDFFVLWFDSIDLPGTTFGLGQASFTALSDSTAPLTITNSYFADVYGADIIAPSVEVPTPASTSLMLLALCLCFYTRQLSLKSNR